MLDEMESYHEAKQVTTVNTRHLGDATHVPPSTAVTVGLMGSSPSRTADRAAFVAPHVSGCTCPKGGDDDDYSVRTVLGPGDATVATYGPNADQRFLYEIPLSFEGKA